MQSVLIAIILVIFGFLLASPVGAAKKFVPKRTATTRVSRGGSSIPLAVRYRPDKRAIHFNFSNFTNLGSASYIFSYQTNGISQGAAGSITANNSPSEVRELLFGTCSTSVCTYHTNLKNARLTFTINYTNGRKASKNYRIRTYF